MKICLTLCQIAMLVGLIFCGHLGAQGIEAVIETGDSLTDELTFTSVASATINDVGDVLVQGTGMDKSGGLRSGIYLIRNGQGTKIIEQGDVAPDGVGNFTGFPGNGSFGFRPALNNNGHVVYCAGFDAGGTAWLYWDGKQNRVILRDGQPSLDNDGTFFVICNAPALSDANQAVIQTSITNSADLANNGSTLVRYNYAADSLSSIVRRGNQFDGAPVNGVTFTGPRAMNDTGAVAFLIQTPQSPFIYLVKADANGISELANDTDDVPGAGEILAFDNISSLNNAGQVGFAARTFSGGVNEAAIVFSNDLLIPIEVGGASFEQVFVDDFGDVVFTRSSGGIFRENSKVVCVQDLDMFGDEIDAFGPSQINSHGQLAIEVASFQPSRNSLYFYDVDNQPIPIIYDGQLLFGSTVMQWEMSQRNSGEVLFRPTKQMNNLGQVVIRYILDDGTIGVGVWSPSSNVVLGDVNLDGVVNLLDVAPFVELLTDGEFQAEADINQDSVVDLLDVAPFVNLLSGG